LNIISSHANFSVDDIEAAKKFYERLGFKVNLEQNDCLLLESPAGTLVQVYEKPDHEPWDSTVFGIEVDDVKAAVEELKLLGIEAENVEGTDENGIATQDGYDAAWVKDPAGNWVCFSNISQVS
jgi:catechol 2,3-dioxygenase-like lactoylglutathione lyase family enzyme